MNDQETPGESGLDDQDDAWIRDLLADARVTDPVPPEVAARLDATLASLQSERAAPETGDDTGDDTGDESGVVVPLRRRLAPLLAAAAAVVVIAAGGFGIAQVARNGSDSNTSASSAASGSADSSRAESFAAESPGTRPQKDAPKALDATKGGLPGLTTTAFAQDAARVMRTLAEQQAAGAMTAESVPSPGDTGTATYGSRTPDAYGKAAAPPVTTSPAATSDSVDLAGCAGPPTSDAVTVPATLDGALVALVFHAPTATAQQVDAWSCDGATLLATASVPH